MPLGDTDTILGMTWVKVANPKISWPTHELEYWKDIQGKTSSVTTIPPEFQDYADVFNKELFQRLPPHREGFDCENDLTPEAVLPKPSSPFSMSNTKSLELVEYLKKELSTRKIRKTKSQVAVPCFFVPKADGSNGLVVKYCAINNITISN